MDFDKFGHCVKCHKCMLIEQAIDSKVQKRFTQDYSELELFLSDGSKMRVAICVDCRQSLRDENLPEIMETVYRGWEKELESSGWGVEKKDKYLKRYNGLRVVCKTDNLPNDVLESKLKEHKDKKNGTHN